MGNMCMSLPSLHIVYRLCDTNNSFTIRKCVCVYERACMCMYMCVYACSCMCACASCVCVCVCVLVIGVLFWPCLQPHMKPLSVKDSAWHHFWRDTAAYKVRGFSPRTHVYSRRWLLRVERKDRVPRSMFGIQKDNAIRLQKIHNTTHTLTDPCTCEYDVTHTHAPIHTIVHIEVHNYYTRFVWK